MNVVKPQLDIVAGQVVATSLEVAEFFGKQHKDVLKRIDQRFKNEDQDIDIGSELQSEPVEGGRLQSEPISEGVGAKLRRPLDPLAEFNRRNFAAVEYLDEQERPQRMFQLTRDGFYFVVMGFTGRKADLAKIAFINEYNRMEQALKQPVLPAEAMPLISQLQDLMVGTELIQLPLQDLEALISVASDNVSDMYKLASETDQTLKAILSHLEARTGKALYHSPVKH